MAYLICAVLLLGAMALLLNNVIQDRLRQQRVMQRLEGDKTGPGKLSLWMRAVGNSKFGQRSVSLDNETQILLNRVGWRTASQRSLFAAFQVCTPVAFAGLGGSQAVSGGVSALVIGLSTYTAAFIAEVVRAGILAVDRGQTEASMALGLTPGQRLRLVTLPQALRVIIPPMTSQYLNLTKNSSLAVAIGYPDLVAVANTTMNQTGQAIEAIAILMAVYLTISLAISAFMNWYNDRVRLVER